MSSPTDKRGLDEMARRWVSDLAHGLGCSPDDIVIELRAEGRVTLVQFTEGERAVLEHLDSMDHLEPYLTGLYVGRKQREGER